MTGRTAEVYNCSLTIPLRDVVIEADVMPTLRYSAVRPTCIAVRGWRASSSVRKLQNYATYFEDVWCCDSTLKILTQI
jgi:hypothetical protein